MATTGIAEQSVGRWFTDNIAGVELPLSFELIPKGHSNLTYLVGDAGGRAFVLRRPPLNQVLATAHDMGREHLIISALSATDLPVPQVLGLCEDEAVNERPFYVMEFVEGLVLRDPAAADAVSKEARTSASRNMAELLARLHCVDPDAVGLGELGRKQDYIARQLRRWRGQLEQTKTPSPAQPGLFAVHEQLSRSIPEQRFTGIVHGDFRLDNCIVSPDGEVLAILDWELCTLGDVLADVAMLLTYWGEPGDDFLVLEDNPTTAAGFGSRDEMLGWYQDEFGRLTGSAQADLRIDYYLAFAAWRIACILEGVYSRYLGGAMGDKEVPGGLDNMSARIGGLVERAERYAGVY